MICVLPRRAARLFAFACLAALICCFPALAENDDDRATPAYWREVEVISGRLNVDVNVNLRSQPSTDSSIITAIEPGMVFRVLNVYSKDWLQISLGDVSGYAAAQYIDTWTEMAQIESADEPDIAIAGGEATFPAIFDQGDNIHISGSVEATQPIVELRCEVYDVRRNAVEKSASVFYEHSDGVRQADLSQFNGRMGFTTLRGGEKELVFTVVSITGSEASLRRNLYVVGQYGAVANMTDACRVTVSRGEVNYLTDGNHRSAWMPGKDSTLSVEIPEDRDAGVFVIAWVRQPTSYRVTFSGASGEDLQVIEEKNPSDMLYMTYDMPEGVRAVTVDGFVDEIGVCEVMVVERGNVSPSLMRWQPLPEKVDILFVSTHQDDELLFLGGGIPYYVSQGKTVAVCYMATCNRGRLNEAMEGLWTCGLRYHPIFLGYEDGHAASVARARGVWGEGALQDLTEVIRRYKPEVIVTQDVNGEYGHMQHQLTVELVREAVDLTNNPDQFPKSAEEYGVWDVKKTYLHLYNEQKRSMTCYLEPNDYFNGNTPLEIATMAYAKHYSQLTDFRMEITGKRYDNTVFGLYRTTVGDDIEMKDFFEHID
ncbi:MAG: PIG-L family deacetylase [Clostridia bacterium]|nr:PIG-L family deacetylase [Clostridia bacterium]